MHTLSLRTVWCVFLCAHVLAYVSGFECTRNARLLFLLATVPFQCGRRIDGDGWRRMTRPGTNERSCNWTVSNEIIIVHGWVCLRWDHNCSSQTMNHEDKHPAIPWYLRAVLSHNSWCCSSLFFNYLHELAPHKRVHVYYVHIVFFKTAFLVVVCAVENRCKSECGLCAYFSACVCVCPTKSINHTFIYKTHSTRRTQFGWMCACVCVLRGDHVCVCTCVGGLWLLSGRTLRISYFTLCKWWDSRCIVSTHMSNFLINIHTRLFFAFALAFASNVRNAFSSAKANT